ncbi:MAG: hypothetical protein MJ077_01075 [Oscillospiraceae bacterium]|nr:hypothetical protein [Oscillospiraceae bacterium]
MKEGCIAGLDFWRMEDMTCGEIVDTVLARREARRRQAQDQSVIAYQQAGLIARAVLEGKLPELYESFPFWTEEEVREMKLEHWRSVMERYAAQKVNREKG